MSRPRRDKPLQELLEYAMGVARVVLLAYPEAIRPTEEQMRLELTKEVLRQNLVLRSDLRRRERSA